MTQSERTLLSEIKHSITALTADLREMASLRWQLALIELRAAIGDVRRLATVMLIAGVMAISSLPILAVAVAEGLDGRLGIARGGWLLIFGVGLLLAALVAAGVAWRRFRRRFAGLQETLEELQEDVVWLREWRHRGEEGDTPPETADDLPQLYHARLADAEKVGDPNGLYNGEMASTYGGIARSGAGTLSNPWVYTAKGKDANWDDRPVNFVSFWDAARFANWLHNGQGNGDTESGAYINIGNQDTFARQARAQYFIPTENEWYKAAYHKNDGDTGNYFDHPTGSDSQPSNDLITPDPGNNANFWQNGYTISDPYYSTVVGELFLECGD